MPRPDLLMHPPIIVAGEALYDLVVRSNGRPTEFHAGGGPFNTARTIGRLSQPVAFVGCLSTDRLGESLWSLLKRDGVCLQSAVRTNAPTTVVRAEVGLDGAASYSLRVTGTSVAGLTPQAALAAHAQRVRVLHVGTLGLVLEPMATAVEMLVERCSHSAIVFVDPNCRPPFIADRGAYVVRLHRLLASTDVVKVSEDDLAWLSPGVPADEAARELLDHGPTIALLTRGADGATVVGAERCISVSAPSVEVVDTIGAGDAFGAAFTAWWYSHGLSRSDLASEVLLTAAVRFACLVASRTCATPGAPPSAMFRTPPRGHPLSEDLLAS